MQKEIEAVLRKYGYAFTAGKFISKDEYDTHFSKGYKEYILSERIINPVQKEIDSLSIEDIDPEDIPF